MVCLWLMLGYGGRESGRLTYASGRKFGAEWPALWVWSIVSWRWWSS